MKRLFLCLSIFISFAIVSGLCSCVTQGERLTPISWEIVEEANVRTQGKPKPLLDKLYYYLSAPLTLFKNEQNRDFLPINGVLHIEETNKSTDTKILTSYKGELDAIIDDNESFVIQFKEGNKVDVKLKFIRDKEKNWFVLDSVVDSPENYTLSSDGIRPYLCIKLDYKNEKNIPIYQNVLSAKGISTPTQPSRNILGEGILTRESIVLYIRSKNTNISSNMLEKIVNTYIDEAKKESVNLDIAIAQMCEGTNFLNNQNRLSTNNYGDLQDIGNPKRRTSFSTMEDGIRAHIQQLKYYASPSSLAHPVDQARLNRVEVNHGKYPTLDQLFSVWVSENNDAHGNRINNILSEMYNFQNRGHS